MGEDKAQPKAPARGSSYPILLLLTVATSTLLAVATTLTVAAFLTGFLELPFALGVAALPALVLPLFLALRGNAALNRRRSHMLLRRLVFAFLLLATQLAALGAVMQFSDTTTGDVAAVAWRLVTPLGMPALSDPLRAHAEARGAFKKPVAAPAADAGPADAGVAAAAPLDGGTAGKPAVDGVFAPAAVDAVGANAPPGGLRPLIPTPNAALVERKPGAPVDAAAALGVTDTGAHVVVTLALSASGGATVHVVDIAQAGRPGVMEVADDGSVAVILDGTQVVTAGAGKASTVLNKQLSRGGKVGGKVLEGIKDIAVGPGGVLGVIAETARDVGAGVVAMDQLLVTTAKGGLSPAVARRSGDAVADAAEGTVIKSFAFGRSPGDGRITVVTTFLDGGDDVQTNVGGGAWSANPQLLLAGRLDQPRAFTEVVRSQREAAGAPGVDLFLFGESLSLVDGRVIFDANFVDDGSAGWLFIAKSGGVFALAPDQQKRGGAPWSAQAPRVKHLDADPSGAMVFIRKDGQAALTDFQKPQLAQSIFTGDVVIGADKKPHGTVRDTAAVRIVDGGEWFVAQVKVDEAGVTRDALVLAARRDLDAGVCEELVATGVPLPTPKGSKGPVRKLRSLAMDAARDWLVWGS